MASKKKARLKARYVPISKVSVDQMLRMYDLYRRYYENISVDLFCKDMVEKNGVFLIQERESRRTVGFSTLKVLDMEVGGKTVTGVFSGDTIIEKEFWGTRVLQVQFFLRMVKEKLKRPYRPLYWLLISKGYKTYLLLANNFYSYYPHPEGRCDHLADYVANYCHTLFPDSFCDQRRLLDFGNGYTHLKQDVAMITKEMCEKNAKIRFFEQCNPSWERGTELPCIGLVDAHLLLRYPLDVWRKRRRSSTLATRSVAYD
tara:strand:+ start:32800 stop:33573 length:774 start_codon:yes stop_codon:yes gene_type:complete